MGAPRLAELLASLGVATDLAAGVDQETSARATLLAVGLGRDLGLRGEALRAVYYTAQLRFIGCTSLAAETAVLGGGEDQQLLGAYMPADAGSLRSVAGAVFRTMGKGGGVLGRAKSFARAMSDPAIGKKIAAAHCEQAVTLAAHLGAPPAAIDALGHVYERFDGRGGPHALAGDAIALPARLLHVALRAEVHCRIEGPAAALRVIAERAGGELDGRLVDAFRDRGEQRLAEVSSPSVWAALLACEPAPHLTLDGAQLVRVAEAFARFADLKSPWTLGHSEAVAERAVAAAERAGMPARERDDLRIAALLHDLGRVAIPNGIWDKPAGLDVLERERVREHAAHTDRILARSPLLAPFARLAAADHERLDASGYPRGVHAPELSQAARLLAASDMYCALREDRPHRHAYDADGAAKLLIEEAAAGRLDRACVGHVLASAGAPTPARATHPCGLTGREVEVLVLLARGLSNKQIGAKLHISPRTAGNHVAHIYEKTKVATRAAAALFAVQHQLVR